MPEQMRDILELARDHGLTRDQLYRMKRNLIAKHGEDDWLHGHYPKTGRMQIMVTEQGVRWIEEVYLNPESSMQQSEIEFLLREIERAKNILAARGIAFSDYYKHYERMTPAQMMDHFRVGKTTIYQAIKKLTDTLPEEIDRTMPMSVSSEGVRWIEENILVNHYIRDLKRYKRSLEVLTE